MDGADYKYNIKKLISTIAYSRKGEKFLRESICKHCRISKTTLSFWENYRLDEKGMIPADQLRRIAMILGVSIDKLFNEVINIEAVQPL